MADSTPLFDEYTQKGNSAEGTFWYGSMSDAQMPDAFLTAADRLWDTATDAQDAERVLLPILYLYRHAIELQLKCAIFEAAHCRAARDGDLSNWNGALTDHLKKAVRHNLGKLMGELSTRLEELELDPISERTVKLID